MTTIDHTETQEGRWLKRNLALFKYALIPLTKKDKERILETYRRAKDKYLLLIEQRTGIDLGDVKVEWIGNSVRREFKHFLNEALKKEKNKVQRIALRIGAFGFYPIMELLRMYKEDSEEASYNTRTQTIDVLFGFNSKIHLLRETTYGFSQTIDENTVHELTHHLWNRIPGRVPSEETPILWKEGFAIYGEHNWFSDFLPEGRNLRNPDI